MTIARFTRNALAGTLMAALPLSSAVGSVRPGDAVPVAASASVVAQDDDGKSLAGTPWFVYGGIALVILIGILLAVQDGSGDDDGDFSEG